MAMNLDYLNSAVYFTLITVLDMGSFYFRLRT
jgi:hypothetical protein